MTLDTWALAWRPADLDNAYVPFASGIGDQTGFSDPAFRAKFAEKNGNRTPEDDVFLASREWEAEVFSGAAHTWEDLELIKAEWDGPIVLKGIQHVEDAKKAVEAGMHGIVVSNHGGRQLDGAIGSLEVLPEIVEAVGDKLTVLFDSGVRTGVDVIKALCLGAKGVLVGRYVWFLLWKVCWKKLIKMQAMGLWSRDCWKTGRQGRTKGDFGCECCWFPWDFSACLAR